MKNILALCALCLLPGLPSWGQTLAFPLELPDPPAEAADTTPEPDEIERAFADLMSDEPGIWRRAEDLILNRFSQSGSPALDLLLRRGRAALANDDPAEALWHFSALVDHDPAFAEGWHGRATAFYLLGEHDQALADLEMVLTLNARHFGALNGVGVLYEELGAPDLALIAYRAALALHPHLEQVSEAVLRLEQELEALL